MLDLLADPLQYHLGVLRVTRIEDHIEEFDHILL